mmetsp:Transcript_23297/g.22898  ORF Transcript_23297/g.22898 Transcript_23297/m.22898 type:complete len:103 (+) Transcript_23297:1298-1606(+)
MKNCKAEIAQVMKEKDERINVVLGNLEKVSNSEMMILITLRRKPQSIKEYEAELMDILTIIIKANPEVTFLDTDLDRYFLNRDLLISTLDDCRYLDYVRNNF